MTESGNSSRQTKTAGLVLLGAALVGALAMAVLGPRTGPGPVSRTPDPRDSTPAATPVPDGVLTAEVYDTNPVPMPVGEPDRAASPFVNETSNDVETRCIARVQDALAARRLDTVGVAATDRYGVSPNPGQSPDSEIVDGTAHSRDATPMVWHCAATKNSAGGIFSLNAAVEDGWPGSIITFAGSHPVTMAAQDACLHAANETFREYVYRGVTTERTGDTLHVRGDAFPLSTDGLVREFHCRAIVRARRVISTSVAEGKK